MARVALGMPHHFQFVVEGPDTEVAVFDDDIGIASRAPEVAEEEAVTEDAGKLVIGHLGVCRHLGGGRGKLCFTCRAVGHGDHHVFAVDDFVLPVAIEVVDLDGHIVGQVVFPGVGLAELPEHFTVEGHGRHAGHFAVPVLGAMVQDLGEEHVDLSVAIQVAEAGVSPYAKIFQVEALPPFHGGVIGLEGCFFRFPCGDDGLDALGFFGGAGHRHVVKEGRLVRGDGNLPIGEDVVFCLEGDAAYLALEALACDGHGNFEGLINGPFEGGFRQDFFVGLVKGGGMLHEFQDCALPVNPEEVITPVVAVAEDQAPLPFVALGRHGDGGGVILPGPVTRHEHGVVKGVFVLVELAHGGFTVGLHDAPGPLRGDAGAEIGHDPVALGRRFGEVVVFRVGTYCGGKQSRGVTAEVIVEQGDGFALGERGQCEHQQGGYRYNAFHGDSLYRCVAQWGASLASVVMFSFTRSACRASTVRYWWVPSGSGVQVVKPCAS